MSDQDQLHDPHRRHGYDPSQPRVPAGQSTGGQWTDTDGPNVDTEPRRKVVRDTTGEEAWSFFHNTHRPDGSLAEQVVFNRDRSRIISEYNADGAAGDWDERHTVIGPDGSKFVFETSGDTQTIYDGEGQVISASVWTENGPEPVPRVQLAGLGTPRKRGFSLARMKELAQTVQRVYPTTQRIFVIEVRPGQR